MTMKPDPIKAITAVDLTDDQITTTRVRAQLAGDDRLVNHCLNAADETGATPARKMVAQKVNDMRRWLAGRLGADFIEAS